MNRTARILWTIRCVGRFHLHNFVKCTDQTLWICFMIRISRSLSFTLNLNKTLVHIYTVHRIMSSWNSKHLEKDHLGCHGDSSIWKNIKWIKTGNHLYRCISVDIFNSVIIDFIHSEFLHKEQDSLNCIRTLLNHQDIWHLHGSWVSDYSHSWKK